MPAEGDARSRQHAAPADVGARPAPPEPAYAERVRTLFSLASVGTLSTLSRRQPGFPFGSLMPYALDEAGRPLLLISSVAMHTQNLKADGRTSLFVAQEGSEGDPLGGARATLVGTAEPVAAAGVAAAREQYLAQHESSRYWVDFADFSFFQLHPVDCYYVGGFGVMGWVDAEAYARARPDPLAGVAAGILAHMNADHEDAMIVLARLHTGLDASEARMTSVDRLGFTLRLKSADGTKGMRINYPREARSSPEVRAALVEMVQQARG